ncbi:hypothetical protein ACFOEE_03260 [Pseudoalteromonas fenneropenaei]|uniref:Transporter substrate-binding domain-containing protein n=1 Tax=Pseudoalteromonas fenneropenaei TaxID=1737459 RepID=A0ABV7CG50_9GAMM
MRLIIAGLLCVFSGLCSAAYLRIQVPTGIYPAIGEAPTDIGATMFAHLTRLLEGKVEIESLEVDPKQEWRILQENPYACFYNKVKTPEREKLAIFSRFPMVAFPSFRLVTNGKLSLPAEIDLATAITEHHLKIGVAKERSYGEHIDKLIAEMPHAFVFTSSYQETLAQRQLLLSGKIDAMLEYSEVMLEYFRANRAARQLKFHTISGESPVVFGYIACARSSQGKMAIAEFENAMRQNSYFEYMINMYRLAFAETEYFLLKSELEKAYHRTNHITAQRLGKRLR